MGTLMCHRGHLADADPLGDVGLKDITAHVNFTGIGAGGAGQPACRCSATRRRRDSCSTAGWPGMLAAEELPARASPASG